MRQHHWQARAQTRPHDVQHVCAVVHSDGGQETATLDAASSFSDIGCPCAGQAGRCVHRLQERSAATALLQRCYSEFSSTHIFYLFSLTDDYRRTSPSRDWLLRTRSALPGCSRGQISSITSRDSRAGRCQVCLRGEAKGKGRKCND